MPWSKSSRCQAISPTWGTDPLIPLLLDDIFLPLSSLWSRSNSRSGWIDTQSVTVPFSAFVLFVRLWQHLLLPPSRGRGCHLAPRTQSGIKRTAKEARSVPRDPPISSSYVGNKSQYQKVSNTKAMRQKSSKVEIFHPPERL